MCCEGLRIESRRYASLTKTCDPFVSCSFEPYTLARLGPRAAALPEWHALHPMLANSLSPFCASDIPLVDSSVHFSYSAGVSTVTSPIIAECLVPQYCVQKIWYVPGVVA